MNSTSSPSHTQRHGFSHHNTTAIPELNLQLHSYHHRKTGARYLHIETDDDNNMFGIGFKTTPDDSTGVAHILEHTVLCGSKNYPVRDPFFSMLRRSLNTFMNALTSSDWTLYPFATRNRSDFYNLMGVYLDAVYFPLLREEDFRQEGHRLEFADPGDQNSPLEIKGIVYNEMKGAMADPSSLLARRLNRAIFPHVTYGCNSGGEPEEIPNLSYDGLRDFHARYYHPANSYLCSYGNLPVEAHLEYIEKHALQHFGELEIDTSVAREERYKTPQIFCEPYPVDAGENMEKRTLNQLGWLTCPIENHEDGAALNVLATLLIGNPATPLYRELLNSGLGLNLTPGSGFHDDLREAYFAAGLQGSEPEHAAEVEKLILDTLEQCAQQGFTQEQIDAALHQLEFSFREVGGDSYPYGLTLLVRLLASWLHNDDPVAPMLTLAHYENIRATACETRLFPQLIRKYLLDNPHRVRLTLYPDAELKAQQEATRQQELQRIKDAFTPQQTKELLAQAEALSTAQESPGDLESLPTLELSDIPRHETPVDGQSLSLAATPCWQYAQPTNGIAYLNLRFDLEPLAEPLIPYLPLFCTLLPQLGAAGQDYLTISQRIAAATGGIRAAAQVIEQADGDDFSRSLEVRAKCLYRNRSEMLTLLYELLCESDFSDHKRMHQVLNQLRISLENGIPASGHSYAIRTAAASLTASGRLKESWSGIEQLRLVREWAACSPDELAPLAARLKEIAAVLINRNALRVHVTAEASAFDALMPELTAFLHRLPEGAGHASGLAPAWQACPAHNGWITTAPVAYVARVFRTVTYTHPDAPGLAVLSRLLRSGYLHREIRERGGAYGGLVSNDPMSGLFSMVSYRDPHISRTLNVFHDAAQWAAEGSFGDSDIKEAILSCFAEIDRPNSPAGRAYREFNCLQQGLTPEVRQAFREGILAIDHQRLCQLAERYLLDGWAKSAVAVLSGEELMMREKERVSPALRIERI